MESRKESIQWRPFVVVSVWFYGEDSTVVTPVFRIAFYLPDILVTFHFSSMNRIAMNLNKPLVTIINQPWEHSR